MIKTTKQQRQAIAKKYNQNNDGAKSYKEFRKRAQGLLGDASCIMIPWCGMWLGIEKDGYTHS